MIRSILFSVVLASSLPAFAGTGDTWTTMINSNASGWNDIQYVRIERLEVSDLKVKPVKYLSYVNDCTGLSKNAGGMDGGTTKSDGSGGSDDTKAYKNILRGGEVIDVRPKVGPGVGPIPNPRPPITPPNGRNPQLDQIVNLAEKIWKFIVDNKPVVNARSIYANALPRGIQCWDELENWKSPRSEVYKASYHNKFNTEVVSMQFRLVYTWGGNVGGVGNYITNASIQYRKLDVAPFFNVDAEVEVPQVVNVGTRKDPVAGMQISVRWKVRGFNHVERTAGFFIYGDGRNSEVIN